MHSLIIEECGSVGKWLINQKSNLKNQKHKLKIKNRGRKTWILPVPWVREPALER
jgi:hypothetical protein